MYAGMKNRNDFCGGIMKKLIWGISALLFFGMACFSVAAEKGRRELILDMLSSYSPTGFHIVNEVDGIPTEIRVGLRRIQFGKYDFWSWTDGDEALAIVNSLNTVVHETCHVYAARMAYILNKNKPNSNIDNCYVFYTGESNILVGRTKSFPSREMANLVPENFRDFRYAEYVTDDSQYQSTQQFGVYGLLDEFNAYYQGTQTSYDLLPWYKDYANQDVDVWLKYIQSIDSTYPAHLQFKLYILCYLCYARQNYPEIYRQIMSNKEFKAAFTTIDRNWTRLIDDYFNSFDKLLSYMKTMEIDAEIRKDEYYFSLRNSKSRTSIRTLKIRREYAKFAEELKKPEYQKILEEISGKSERGVK
jgi:hypothetical protein